MVVIATPIPHPTVQCCESDLRPVTLEPLPCAGLNVISAPISTINGRPIMSRMRSITVTQNQDATIEWQMHDQTGHPIDLRLCGFSESESSAEPTFKVVLRLREHLATVPDKNTAAFEADVVDAEEGKVQVALGSAAVCTPGVYFAEIALVSIAAEEAEQPSVVFSNTFFLVVTRGAFGNDKNLGPPTIMEIRLHLRDSGGEESFLLDHLMFDDAEIALAISRPIMYWNETPPFLRPVYTTQNFPYRYHWLEGICANLFFMVAEQFRRNQLSYNAAGIALDDQNKEPNYERAGQMRWQTYREWVRATKAAINLEGCYSTVTSQYSRLRR